jgi:predicted nucleotidyltransferase
VRTALPGLLAEMLADPTLRAKLRERFESAVWDQFRDRIAAAVERGEVRPDADADVIIDAIAGAALVSLTLRSSEPLDDDWVGALTDLLVKGIRA